MTIPTGALVSLHIPALNADATLMGDSPLQPCSISEMAESKPRPWTSGMSFGDGQHRCPGSYLAVQETDIFLRRLLVLPTLKVEKEPTLIWNDIVSGYEVRDFIVSV